MGTGSVLGLRILVEQNLVACTSPHLDGGGETNLTSDRETSQLHNLFPKECKETKSSQIDSYSSHWKFGVLLGKRARRNFSFCLKAHNQQPKAIPNATVWQKNYSALQMYFLTVFLSPWGIFQAVDLLNPIESQFLVLWEVSILSSKMAEPVNIATNSKWGPPFPTSTPTLVLFVLFFFFLCVLVSVRYYIITLIYFPVN